MDRTRIRKVFVRCDLEKVNLIWRRYYAVVDLAGGKTLVYGYDSRPKAERAAAEKGWEVVRPPRRTDPDKKDT